MSYRNNDNKKFKCCAGLDSVLSVKPLTVDWIREKPNVDIDKTLIYIKYYKDGK